MLVFTEALQSARGSKPTDCIPLNGQLMKMHEADLNLEVCCDLKPSGY